VIIDYPKKNFNLLLDARADALPYDLLLEFFAWCGSASAGKRLRLYRYNVSTK
jgi:hypothetical protein